MLRFFEEQQVFSSCFPSRRPPSAPEAVHLSRGEFGNDTILLVASLLDGGYAIVLWTRSSGKVSVIAAEELGLSTRSRRLFPDGQIDPAAVVLGNRLGGQASVRLEGFGNREFDFISGRYVGQTFGGKALETKPKNFLNPSRRTQIRKTIEAAKATDRLPLFNFEGVIPHPEIVSFICRNADRLNIKPVITNITPKPR